MQYIDALDVYGHEKNCDLYIDPVVRVVRDSVAQLNPESETNPSEEDYDQCFYQAITDWGVLALTSRVSSALNRELEKKRVRHALENHDISNALLELESRASIASVHEILGEYRDKVVAILFPTSGQWRVQCIVDHFRFPEAWSNAEDGKIAEITGVPEAIFCHNSGHMIGASSRDGAIALFNKARALLLCEV